MKQFRYTEIVKLTEKQYLTAVCAFGLFGPQRVKLLLSYFKKAKRIWAVKRTELVETGLKKETVDKFINFRNSFSIEEYFLKLKKLKVRATTVFDGDYPGNMKDLVDAPQVLYIRGKIRRSDSNAVAIVGSRMMSSYGKDVAEKFAVGLASYGVTVVSGLALGVDSESQRSAIAAGGRTIAVLASGLNIITPSANTNLAAKIIDGNGALVSEYPIDYVPRPYDFPIRDRIISGLSKAVVVVEGRMKSGTFHTVKAALDQGKPVFAVPGPITSPLSEGPNYLIKNGAKLVASVEEILEELDMQLKVDFEKMENIMPAASEDKKIIEILETEPTHLDELVRISGFTTPEISARLTIMEMKGLVKNLGGGVYRKI